MKKTLAAAVSIGLASLTTLAHALPLNTHAAGIFQPFFGVDSGFIHHTTSGVTNGAATNKIIVGTPARNPHASGSQSVQITGANNAISVYLTCTVYAMDPNNSPVSAKSIVATSVAGNWVRGVSFTTAEAPANATYAIWCNMPASQASTIHGVSVSP